MRHLITIVVVWTQGYLFAPELLQLPALFIHYQEHRDLNEAIGFEEFLVLHYSDHDHARNCQGSTTSCPSITITARPSITAA